MPTRRIKVVDFTATDAHGNAYRLHVFEHQTRWTDPSGQSGWKAMERQIETSDGKAVNYKSPGHYELLTTRGPVELTSTDPDAV
jgi:hypothetical protein